MTMKIVNLQRSQPIILILFCSMALCMAQGTLAPIYVTFEGPPIQPPGTAVIVQEYNEAGMLFTSSNLPGFVRVGSSPVPARPGNGTSYLQAPGGGTFQFRFADGSLFSLDSVDLAEYSTVVPNAVTMRFVGYYPDGSTVTENVTTDGIIDGTGPLADFQTFRFQSFYGVARVEVPTSDWSLDNLAVSRLIP
jgi:hypothetical protein